MIDYESLRSAPCLVKREQPVLTYKDIPYNAALIFNAGVTKFNGKYVMVAEEYLPADFNVKEIRVEYKKAAVLNDELYPRVTITDKDVTVVLADAAGSPYATVLFIK